MEIARALSFGARFIILDEPTAQLDAAGDRAAVRRGSATLQAQGVTFLFISHHLQEIYEICDTVTVFRDARHILTAPVAELAARRLVAAMTGEDVTAMPRRRPTGRCRRDAAGACSTCATWSHAPAAETVDFEVRGRRGRRHRRRRRQRQGRGRRGDRRAAPGRPPATVDASTAGALRPGSVPDALAAGVGLVPQDRHREGLVPLLSIAENVTMTVPRPARRGTASSSPRRRDALARGR